MTVPEEGDRPCYLLFDCCLTRSEWHQEVRLNQLNWLSPHFKFKVLPKTSCIFVLTKDVYSSLVSNPSWFWLGWELIFFLVVVPCYFGFIMRIMLIRHWWFWLLLSWAYPELRISRFPSSAREKVQVGRGREHEQGIWAQCINWEELTRGTSPCLGRAEHCPAGAECIICLTQILFLSLFVLSLLITIITIIITLFSPSHCKLHHKLYFCSCQPCRREKQVNICKNTFLLLLQLVPIPPFSELH